MSDNSNRQGWLRHPLWTVIATIVAILSLLVAIFVWFIPNRNSLFSAQQPSPAIPQLKPFYNGTTPINSQGTSYPSSTWYINSQDQKGNFSVTIIVLDVVPPPSNRDSKYSCKGTITRLGRISIPSCQPNDFRFDGVLYPDGHIEGIRTYSDGTQSQETLR
jgi:hypothetical protein